MVEGRRLAPGLGSWMAFPIQGEPPSVAPGVVEGWSWSPKRFGSLRVELREKRSQRSAPARPASG